MSARCVKPLALSRTLRKCSAAAHMPQWPIEGGSSKTAAAKHGRRREEEETNGITCAAAPDAAQTHLHRKTGAAASRGGGSPHYRAAHHTHAPLCARACAEPWRGVACRPDCWRGNGGGAGVRHQRGGGWRAKAVSHAMAYLAKSQRGVAANQLSA